MWILDLMISLIMLHLKALREDMFTNYTRKQQIPDAYLIALHTESSPRGTVYLHMLLKQIAWVLLKTD